MNRPYFMSQPVLDMIEDAANDNCRVEFIFTGIDPGIVFGFMLTNGRWRAGRTLTGDEDIIQLSQMFKDCRDFVNQRSKSGA